MLHPTRTIILVCADNTVRSIVDIVHYHDGKGVLGVQGSCYKYGKYRVQKLVYVSSRNGDVGCADQCGLRDKPFNFLVDVMLHGTTEIYWINQRIAI
jgi:hypothetical protein